MKEIISIAFVVLTLLTACNGNNDGRETSQYNKISATTPDCGEFTINEVLKPVSMVIGNKYLCVLHNEHQDGDQVFVYDADNLDFKYKFAKRGTGPNETLALDLVMNMRDDTLYLIDQAKYKLLSYKLQDDKPIFLSESYLVVPTSQPLQEIYMINDSVMIYNTLENDLVTYNIAEEKTIDQLSISSLIEGLDIDSEKQYGDFNFSYNNGDVYVTMRFLDKIFKLRVDSAFSILNNDVTPFENTINRDARIIDIPRYHIYVSAGNDYVMTQYYGYRLRDMQPFPQNPNGQNLKYEFMIFDKSLTSIAKLQPNTDLLRGFFDEKRHRIYYLEALEDFDNLKYISF